MATNKVDCAHIAQLRGKATQGPWSNGRGFLYGPANAPICGVSYDGKKVSEKKSLANAALIAAVCSIPAEWWEQTATLYDALALKDENAWQDKKRIGAVQAMSAAKEEAISAAKGRIAELEAREKEQLRTIDYLNGEVQRVNIERQRLEAELNALHQIAAGQKHNRKEVP